MTNNNSNNGSAKTNNPLKSILKVAVVLDLLWAILFATVSATMINAVGGVAGAGSTSVGIATVGAWLLTFFIAMFQGAVFFIVLGGFIFAGFVIFGKKKTS